MPSSPCELKVCQRGQLYYSSKITNHSSHHSCYQVMQDSRRAATLLVVQEMYIFLVNDEVHCVLQEFSQIPFAAAMGIGLPLVHLLSSLPVSLFPVNAAAVGEMQVIGVFPKDVSKHKINILNHGLIFFFIFFLIVCLFVC